MIRIETGEPDRVVTSTDYESEDLLSWDWTTLPAGCEALDQSPDMAELLTVRPYDGLPTSADPLGRKCDLPTKAETMDAVDWPTLAPPKVERRRVQWARPPFPPAPPLPQSDWPVSQWDLKKRRRLPPGVQPPPPPQAVSVTWPNFMYRTTQGGSLNFVLGSASCLPSGQGQSITGTYGHFIITGGPAEADYEITIGLANNANSPSSFTSTWWEGTRGPSNDWWAYDVDGLNISYEGGSASIPAALRYSQVGGGASGWIVRNIYFPDVCGS